jgi:hypothetical protein
MESYTWAMEKHALPILRDLRVRELARAHVKALASALVAKLSKKSAAIILGTLHACLEEAVDEEIVSVNIAARCWL